MRKIFTMFSSVLLLVFCFSINMLAQETSGEIQGTIKDQTGAVVPNVTITIRGVDVGFNRTVNSDDQGYYRARQIPPGIYTVSAAATSGFTGQEKSNVQVVLGQASNVDFDLSIEASAQVDVLADGGGIAIDPTDSKTQESITAREIESLPKGNTFSSLLRTTTAARAEPNSGGFQINGGSGSENSFIVDGQEVSNFRTGVLNGNNDIPYQSVQEVQVKSAGFEAEYGGATGGVVNVATKSGTNDLRGEFGMQFSSQKLNAGPRPILARTQVAASLLANRQYIEYLDPARDRGTDVFPVASLGGPVIKDKVWFYGIYAPRIFNTQRTTQYFTTALPPGVGNQPAGYVNRRLNTTETYTSKQTNEYAFIKLDASPTNNFRISSSFNWNPIIVEGILPANAIAIGGAPPSADFGGSIGTQRGAALTDLQGGRQNANNFRVEGVYTPNSNLVTTLRYTRGFLNERAAAYNVPRAPRFICADLFANGELSGCPSIGFQNINNNTQITKDVSIRNTVDADVSYLVGSFGGRHEFKGGYQFNKISNDVDRGYADQGIIQLYYGYTINDLGPPIPLPENPTAIGAGILQRFQTRGNASNRNQALYIQDKWQPFSRLTLNLGVRTEQEDLPAFNGNVTNLKFSFKDKLAPRLGFAYDLTGDGKTRVSAFYGWFYDRLKFELPRGSFGGDFFRLDFFEILPGAPLFNQQTIQRILGNYSDPIGGGCNINTAATGGTSKCQLDYRVPSNLPAGTVLDPNAPLQPGAVDPNLKPFRQSEFTVEVQREVMTSSVFKARYLYRNVDSAVEDAGFKLPPDFISEVYIIANPCEGLHLQRNTELGFSKCAKPQRRYDALQLEYDTRFIQDLNLNINYTYSRLYGNYSGLASSDENGRTSPGVNRFFDQPYVGYTVDGTPDNGRLATDRPHVFKASGSYNFDWFDSNANATEFGFFTTVQSGTPLTSFAHVYDVDIVNSFRGDLGRTETFTQTDLNLSHRYRFGRDQRYTVAFDVNVLNALNEHNVLGVFNNAYGPAASFQPGNVAAGLNYVQAVNRLLNGGVRAQYEAYSNSNVIFRDARLNKPNSFQGPRNVRFGFRFLF